MFFILPKATIVARIHSKNDVLLDPSVAVELV